MCFIKLEGFNLKTIDQINGKLEEDDFIFSYQEKLTKRLDTIKNITKTNLNEIILWKLNRYIYLNKKSLKMLNEINPNSYYLKKKLTKLILSRLLSTKGIGLPFASTLLRFKNPKVYQIIDQRVYRFIYGKELRLSSKKTDELIDIYFEYLNDLKKKCKKYKIRFRNSDRILYNADKRLNKQIKLR